MSTAPPDPAHNQHHMRRCQPPSWKQHTLHGHRAPETSEPSISTWHASEGHAHTTHRQTPHAHTHAHPHPHTRTHTPVFVRCSRLYSRLLRSAARSSLHNAMQNSSGLKCIIFHYSSSSVCDRANQRNADLSRFTSAWVSAFNEAVIVRYRRSCCRVRDYLRVKRT